MSRLAFLSLATVVVFTLRAVGGQEPAAADPDPTRFEEDIQEFEQQDKEAPPEPGGVVFVGSSSIRGWDLPASFPGLDAVNRGFGGSQLSDAVHYADRVVVPYRPRLIVLYEGDNDINAGKTPEQVRDDLAAFVRIVREEHPEARIAVLSIKPSLARWELWDAMESANLLMARFCADDPRMTYVDVASPLLGPDRRPRPEFYVEDGLHLSERGYEVWADRLRPVLDAHPAARDRQAGPPDVGSTVRRAPAPDR